MKLGNLNFLLILFSLNLLAQDKKLLSVEFSSDDIKFEGTLDKEAIRRRIKSKINEFESCGLTEGKLDLVFQVSKDGEITDSKAVLLPKRHPVTEDCFKAVLSTVDFKSGIQQSTKMSLEFEIGRKEQRQQAQKVEQAKIEENKSNSTETEAEKINREYGKQKREQALAEMTAQIERQKSEQAVSLDCYQKFQKDKLFENYERCLAQGSKGHNPCQQNCESQRTNLEVSCQRCSGKHVARQNCISTCQKNIASQINQCKSDCR